MQTEHFPRIGVQSPGKTKRPDTNKKLMKTTMKSLTGATAMAAIVAGLSLWPVQAREAAPASQPLVQIALLLDTSGSMQGLIEQAKGQLWKIVNEFINARQNGRRPALQVALYEYGKSSLPGSEGYLRQIVPLSTDLDKLSEELFALKTNGGEEYCGWVIKEAAQALEWSPAPNVYKAIFIAGNEPFTQGPVHYVESCKAAVSKGIIVNTIHCGDDGVGINTKWQDGALLADGKYMVIDHNRAVVHFAAPQDKEIARLGAELNGTYLAFGVAGRASQRRQEAQDANAVALAPQGALLFRSVAKASSNYRNENWDLVDALKADGEALGKVKAAELPPEMQPMNEEQRKAYVEDKARERAALQAKIQQLNVERQKYVAEQMKQHTAKDTLDAVMVSAIREQAQQKNFKFE